MGIAQQLRQWGRATDRILQKLLPPEPGMEDLAAAVGYVEYAGSPVTNLTPDFVGQRCFDTTSGVWYHAAGVTAASWQLGLTAIHSSDGKIVGGVSPRIAILSDSLSADSALTSARWPSVFERILRQGGVYAEVRAFAVNANTCYRMNNTVQFGTYTPVQAVVAYKPDVVIFVGGYNDAISKVDSRTLVQIKDDVLTTMQALRAGLPRAKIFYGAQLTYDLSGFSGGISTLKNKGVIPQLWTLPASGYRSGLVSAEDVDTTLATATKDALSDWLSWHSYVLGLSQIDGAFTIDGFRVCRLGLTSSDRLHVNSMGHAMVAAYVLKGLGAISAWTSLFPTLASQVLATWYDPDAFFLDWMTASGDAWVTSVPADTDGIVPATTFGPDSQVRCETWMHPYKGSCSFSSVAASDTIKNVSDDARGLYVVSCQGLKPNSSIYLSFNGASFVDSGLVTDSSGSFWRTGFIGAFGLSNGALAVRIKVGSSSYGPFNVTLTA